MIRQKSFTLIELLVVIAIVGLISSLIFTALSGSRPKARDSQRIQDLNTLRTALELYYNDNSQYPPNAGKIGDGESDATINSEIAKYLTAIPTDPNGPDNSSYFYYYDPAHVCNSGDDESTVVYAKTMEEAKNSQYTDTCDNVGVGATDPIAETRVVFITTSNTLASGSSGTNYTLPGSGLVAWWNLDETSGTRYVSGGTCGSDCNLNDINTVTYDTTNKKEGFAAGTFASGEYLECLDATCGELDTISGSDISYGCWGRISVDFQRYLIRNRVTSQGGYDLLRNSTNDTLGCRAGDGSSSIMIDSLSGTYPTNTFVHGVCVFDNTWNHLQPYIDGLANGAGATLTNIPADTANFSLSWSAASWNGELDECFVFNKALSDEEICEICKYGITGNEDRTSICNC